MQKFKKLFTNQLKDYLRNFLPTYTGIYLLWRFNLNIPPNKPEVSGDMNCAWKQDIPLYIFAFR